MNADHAEAVVRRLLGYWPSPALTAEEGVAWAQELTTPDLELTFTEVDNVLRRASYAGQVHRLRPGEVVAAVKSERRAQARITDTSKMLAESRAGAVSPERVSQWVRTCHRALAGEDIEEAKIAEGTAS